MTTQVTAGTGKTNFIQGLSGEAEEIHAYREMLDYLIDTGRYADAVEADNDAMERVRFCEEMDLYADDVRLRDASLHQRKIHALIHSNKLQAIIADNGGYLPGVTPSGLSKQAVEAAAGEILPATTSAPAAAKEHEEVKADRTRPRKEYPANEPVLKKAVFSKENVFLQIIRYLSNAAIIIAVLLASSVFFFSSEDRLQLTKYNFFLFVVLMIVSVGLSEVSSRLMLRVRYAVSYLSFISSASLSGMLFLQQPWAESAFDLRGGLFGVVINYIIHRIILIGPLWLGAFFAVITFVFLVASWRAGRKIRDALSVSR